MLIWGLAQSFPLCLLLCLCHVPIVLILGLKRHGLRHSDMLLVIHWCEASLMFHRLHQVLFLLLNILLELVCQVSLIGKVLLLVHDVLLFVIQILVRVRICHLVIHIHFLARGNRLRIEIYNYF